MGMVRAGSSTDMKAHALQAACRAGQLDDVRSLIELSADVNFRSSHGRTALSEAASAGQASVVSLLIETGARLNGDANVRVDTSLVDACRQGYACVVRALVSSSADPNAKHLPNRMHASSALIYAAYSGHAECISALTELGADVNIQDADGHTALMEASRQGHRDAVRALLAAGASLDACNSAGCTALEIARTGRLHYRCRDEESYDQRKAVATLLLIARWRQSFRIRCVLSYWIKSVGESQGDVDGPVGKRACAEFHREFAPSKGKTSLEQLPILA